MGQVLAATWPRRHPVLGGWVIVDISSLPNAAHCALFRLPDLSFWARQRVLPARGAAPRAPGRAARPVLHQGEVRLYFTITHLQHAICNMPMHVECVVQYVFRCEFEWHSSLLFSGTHMPCLVACLFSFASPCAMDPT